MQISFLLMICEPLQGLLGSETVTLLRWGLYVMIFVAICSFTWRFYTGFYRDGDFWGE